MRFLRWYFIASITVAVTLPLIAVVVALITGINLTDALAPVVGFEFWVGIGLWLPVTAIGVLVFLLVWATKFLPWVAHDS